jgi:hypothetical protein
MFPDSKKWNPISSFQITDTPLFQRELQYMIKEKI